MCLNSGYIKIHRSIWEWEWHDDPLTMSLWLFLLSNANYEDVRWHGIEVLRGQLVTSVASIVAYTGLTTQQVKVRLNRLEKSEQIVVKTTNKYSIITICNYESYQCLVGDEQQTNNNQATNKQQSNNNQITTIEERKERKEDNSIVPPQPEGTSASGNSRLMKRPTLDEIQAFISEKGYDVDANTFFSFYESNGWKVGKNAMKNWKAAIATWDSKNRNNGSGYRTQDNKRQGTCPTATTQEEYTTTF